MLRKAIEQFFQDTDRYPKQLTDVAALTAPATGIDGGGREKPIDQERYEIVTPAPRRNPFPGAAFQRS